MRPMDPKEDRQGRLNAYAWRRMTRHWLWLLVAALCCGAAFYGVAAQRPVLHQADSSLIYRFGREYFPANPAITAWEGEPVRVFVDEAIHTEMEILGSRKVLAATLRRFPAEQQLANQIGINEYAAKRLSIKRVEGTYLVKVAYRHEERGMTEAFVTTLLADYLVERERLLANDPSQTLMEAEVATGAELARLRAERAELAGAMGAPNPLQDGAAPSLTAQAALDTDVALTEERYRQIAKLRGEYQLAARIDGARGPAIEVLDAPRVALDPLGLPLFIQALLATLAAMMALSAAVFAWVWLKIPLEQPKPAEDFLEYFLKARPGVEPPKVRRKEKGRVR